MQRELSVNLSQYIDHTFLKPDATAEMIDRLCDEAKQYGFYCVCVHPIWVKRASMRLEGSHVKVGAAIGFPCGATFSEVKAKEAEIASREGAHELDMVLAISALKSKDYRYVEQDISHVVKAAPSSLVKVILETCLLTDAEKKEACRIAMEAGAHFVKTSTGFSSGGATVGDVQLMRAAVGPEFGVKASGGIRDAEIAYAMIQSGATRLGTSAGVAISTAKKCIRPLAQEVY